MLRQLFTLVLLIAIGAGAYFWFSENISACRTPLPYRIGTIDEGFDITKEKAKASVSGAERMWEELTGEELFVYSEDAAFTVNFVFDTRQQLTNEEHELREVLNQKENLSESIKEEYDVLIGDYKTKKIAYESRLSSYESDLATYNEEVEEWNEKGGAPKEIFERLNREQQELSRESRTLAATARELNNLVARINTLGEEGNELVEDYNQDVAVYNDRFNHEYEFTQGDYRGNHINIYQFDNETELRVVLAHELGHALSLSHVDDPNAVMYYLMDVEEHQGGLTLEDWNEFKRVCGS